MNLLVFMWLRLFVWIGLFGSGFDFRQCSVCVFLIWSLLLIMVMWVCGSVLLILLFWLVLGWLRQIIEVYLVSLQFLNIGRLSVCVCVSSFGFMCLFLMVIQCSEVGRGVLFLVVIIIVSNSWGIRMMFFGWQWCRYCSSVGIFRFEVLVQLIFVSDGSVICVFDSSVVYSLVMFFSSVESGIRQRWWCGVIDDEVCISELVIVSSVLFDRYMFLGWLVVLEVQVMYVVLVGRLIGVVVLVCYWVSILLFKVFSVFMLLGGVGVLLMVIIQWVLLDVSVWVICLGEKNVGNGICMLLSLCMVRFRISQ